MTFNIMGREEINFGQNCYYNALPLFNFANKERLQKNGVNIHADVPSVLNKMLSEGKLDVAMISSFEYGLNCDDYFIFPELSVTAYKEVNSIFYFSYKPIEELKNTDRVALTKSSASSAGLFKIIAREYYDVDPNYNVMEPNLEKMLEENDGALLIGDDAIREKWIKGVDPNLKVYDLAGLWHKNTKLSMSFLLVAVRKESLIPEKMDGIMAIFDECLKSKIRNQLNDFSLITSISKDESGGSDLFWTRYYRKLYYNFGENEIKGLEEYFRLAHKYGLIKKPVKVELLEIKKTQLA